MHAQRFKNRIFGFVTGIACLFLPQILVAETDIPAVERAGTTGLFEVQSRIMEINYGKKYMIVAEKRVDLIDYREGGQRYRTLLKNSRGNRISFRSFKRKNWVFVRGLELGDDRIAAREIYRLPRFVEPEDYGKYPFFKEVAAWPPADVK